MTKFAKEFLAASAVFAVCLLWIFRAALATGQVEAFQAHPPSAEALLDISEELYEVESQMVVQARIVKAGFFPSWTPYSAGGNPLIGKMQNAVFAPEHLLLYIFPAAALPYLLMLVVSWKLYLAFIFTYLYARCLLLDSFAGIFAGIVYVFMEAVYGGLFSWSATAPYLPLLLLLVESYLRGHRRRAQFLLPWAVAFTFFSGHFESAFYINLVAGLYLLGRLWIDADLTLGEKFGRCLGYVVPASAGAILAGVQIAPAVEYVRYSYNRVWHDSALWGFWDYDTVSKHLSRDDAPMLALGLAALLLFAAALRRCVAASRKPPSARLLLAAIAAAGSLAAALACLSNLGLDDSLGLLPCFNYATGPGGWIAGSFMLFLAFWAWRAEDRPPGIRILGVLLIGSVAFSLKLPFFSNVLLHVPIFKHFHNARGHRWELQLAAAVLCAAGFQNVQARARDSWASRLKTAGRAACILGVFVVGYLISQPLKGLVARAIPAGIDAASGAPTADGGITSPTKELTYNRTVAVAGWIPASPPAVSVAVNMTPAVPANQVTADMSPRGARRRFFARIPVEPGNFTPKATVTYADGSQRALANDNWSVVVRRRGRAPMIGWLLVGALALFPLVFLCGAVVPRCAAALLLMCLMGQSVSSAIPASQTPYRLGGIDKIKEDRGLFRVDALPFNLLQADYLNTYGLMDIRQGGDNLDVLTHIYFATLATCLMADSVGTNDLYGTGQKESYEKGLRVYGLANVKYFLDVPGTAARHPGLEPFYRGADLTVFKNKYFGARASFHDRGAFVPTGDMMDWGGMTRIIAPTYQFVNNAAFDEKGALLLNDAPMETFPGPVPPGAARSSVRIQDYSPDKVRIDVETDRPGFIFLADTMFPGWAAFRNGLKIPILRSWLTFRAVSVPAGKSVVEFFYRPVVLLIALDLSAAAALVWLLLYCRYRLSVTPLESTPDETIGVCLISAERLELFLIAAVLLFWTVWSAARYEGGIQRGWHGQGWGINLFSGVLLVAAAAAFAFRAALARAGRIVFVLAGLALGALGVLAWGGTKYWGDFEVPTKNDPGHALNHYNRGVSLTERGNSLAQQGKIAEAFQSYELAMRENPDYAVARANLAAAHFNVGLTLAGQGRTDEAIAQYVLALQAQPDLAPARFHLGAALAAQGKWDEAIAQYELAIRARPEYAEAHYNLGVALEERGRVDEAVRHYVLATRAQPGLAAAQNNLGLALYAQGKWDEAIGHYALALKAQPGLASAHFNLGLALAKQAKTHEAIEQFRETLRIDPGFAHARDNLESLLRQLPQ